MARKRRRIPKFPASLPRKPVFDEETWALVIEALGLSPQQARIVELILQGQCDKQIACKLGKSVATIRTHLGRIFDRNNLGDRSELILLVFAVTQFISMPEGCHHS